MLVCYGYAESLKAQFANMSKNLLRSFMDKLGPKLRAMYRYSIITEVRGRIPLFMWVEMVIEGGLDKKISYAQCAFS